jgi:cytoskeletal protein RodZ
VESLGEKLKTAREDKGISLDDAGKDTKISIRYLEALEKEDFSGFPGEAYITGFLRNYSTYLDLDVQELLSLYYALKIQEQPIPEQLLRKTPQILPKIIIGILVGLIIAGVGGRAVYYFMNRRPREPRVTAPVVRAPIEYVMDGDSFERRFYKGDSILVPAGTDQFKLELLNLGDEVTIHTPNGPVTVNLSQEATVELGDNAPELRISAMDYTVNNADMGVLLRLELGNGGISSSIPAITGVNAQTASSMIFSSPNPYPFTLQLNFQGYCMFRWEILMERDRRDRNERYFQRSDPELNIQAQNGIRLWVSNAQAVKFQVIGGGRTVPIEIGGPGEVVVADIRWVRDDDNRYRLVVLRLET